MTETDSVASDGVAYLVGDASAKPLSSKKRITNARDCRIGGRPVETHHLSTCLVLPIACTKTDPSAIYLCYW